MSISLDNFLKCNYSNYMETRLIRIGNSRGIRIPQAILELYHMQEGNGLEIEARRDGILIRPLPDQKKVSWQTAYAEMAAETEERYEWAEWDGLAGNGPDA